jgi:outer membrane protein insertion porin family
VDVGSLWKIKQPVLLDARYICSPTSTNTTDLTSFTSSLKDCSKDQNNVPHNPANFTSADGFKEVFFGNSPKPRLSVGVGVNWVSPFGPLRLDIAKALLKQKGDDTKLFTFNVGTQF